LEVWPSGHADFETRANVSNAGENADGFFPGFRLFDIKTAGATIHGRIGGSGPPLLLLHGSPQTHVMWHKVAPILAERFTVVVADLRGYGDSSKPESAADHGPYTKRAMAQDMAEVMSAHGFDQFMVAGHDRGGRVAHRLALDHAARVQKIAVLDIAPTREMYAGTNDAFARAYWHWFFLIQPAPFPEKLIGADPDAYFLRGRSVQSASTPFDPAALAEYMRCFRNPQTIHANCEDYRAAATTDIAHDNADGGKLVEAPFLVIWGKQGVMESCFDTLALWRQRVWHVEGYALPGGHYLAEQLPKETAEGLSRFFST